ncbi:unnamed protein product [Penicillium discolor]
MDLLTAEHGWASRLIIGSEIDLPMIVQLNLGTWESRARSVHGIECRRINPWVKFADRERREEPGTVASGCIMAVASTAQMTMVQFEKLCT